MKLISESCAGEWSADYYDYSDSDEPLTILVTAYSDSSNIYYQNENVYSGMNLYDTILTSTQIEATLEFQVAVSSWLDVGSVEFFSSNTDVASINVRLNKDNSHIFTLVTRGYGIASISMSLDGSDPMEVFSIIVGAEKDSYNQKDSLRSTFPRTIGNPRNIGVHRL